MKKRNFEILISSIFIASLSLYLVIGFQYFSGFSHAPLIIRSVLVFFTINIYICLLYFVYRFLEWCI